MEKREKVIVSLTSFPAAIKYAVEAVKSILAGTVLPDRIVLYLNMAQFGETPLPEELMKLIKENSIFEIRNYDPEIRSYIKLVPALEDFPEAVIVTIDDDIIYHKRMLERLLDYHRAYPDRVIAHRVRKIRLDEPYTRWKKYRWKNFLFKRDHAAYGNLLTGVGGVLYPPHVLKEEMMRVELFTKIAPTADDLWFWAAAVANNRKIMPVPFGYNHPREIGKPSEISLMHVNYKSGEDKNKAALDAIMTAYPEIKKKLETE